MKIFLDVGGHRGETLAVVLSPKFYFDLVHCFEPIPELYDFIKTEFADDIASGKLQVHNFGLADFTGEQKLYGTGEQEHFGDGLGASLFSDKQDIDNQHYLTCKFVKASEWLQQHIAADDLVILKMNCEGGEVLILRDLMASGKIHDLDFVYIDFDIVKIPSQKAQKEKVLAELKAVKFNRFITNKVLYRPLGYADSTNRIICAMPNAKNLVDLTRDDKILIALRNYAPTIFNRWYLRRRKRNFRNIGLAK